MAAVTLACSVRNTARAASPSPSKKYAITDIFCPQPDADGIAGPLVIDGPSTTEFDEDKGPIMLSDWYHKDAFSIYYIETTGRKGPPDPQSVLINGKGVFSKPMKGFNGTDWGCIPDMSPHGENSTCRPEGAGMYSTYFEPGKKYKLRLINTSANTHFSFWIEGHDFTIVTTDFVPIEPYKVSYVNVAIGKSCPLCSGQSLWLVSRWLILNYRPALRDHRRGKELYFNERQTAQLLDQDALLRHLLRRRPLPHRGGRIRQLDVHIPGMPTGYYQLRPRVRQIPRQELGGPNPTIHAMPRPQKEDAKALGPP